MAWRTPPGTGCPQAESLCSAITPDRFNKGIDWNYQNFIGFKDSDSIYITNFALGANPRLQATRPLEALLEAGRRFMRDAPTPGLRLQSSSDFNGFHYKLCSGSDSETPGDPAPSGGLNWSQTPIHVSRTPIRKPDGDPSSWRLQRIHTPDDLMAWSGVPPSRKLMFRYRLRCWPLTRRPVAGVRSRSVSQTQDADASARR